jgi:hypothetical protein
MAQVRYQVVYKKLIRCLRKFYARKMATGGYGTSTDDCEKLYSSYLEFVADEFGREIHELRLSPEELAISLGALTNPKLLLKHFEGQVYPVARVQTVYDYLYKFSFERLQDYLNDPIMVMLFFRMMEVRAASSQHEINPINSLAEHEACLLILQHSCFAAKLAHIYH